MYRTEGVLVLLALCVGLAHSFSWDIVVTGVKQLEFYDNNGTRTHIEDIKSHASSLAYDSVHNRVLFADQTSEYSSISSLDIATRKIIYLYKSVRRPSIEIAYDPATQLLFWTETGLISGYSILSKLAYSNAVEEKLLIKLDEVEPISGVTVESCGGYIYWATNRNIQRARIDGSDREVIIVKDCFQRSRIAIDHQTQKMYWSDFVFYGSEHQMSIESADLNGKNRRTFYVERDHDLAKSLLVSKDFIYWRSYATFSQLTKNPPHDKEVEPKQFSLDKSSFSVGMASNYKIDDQIQNCEAQKRLQPVTSETKDCASLNVTTDVSLLCVHGTKVSGESRCECTQGYIGERCEVSVCHNYCLQGDCSVSAEGQPKCRCYAGYSGERCEVNACHEYCSNNGVCSLSEDSEPVCQCTGDYEGERCDVSVFLVKCLQTVSLLKDILNTDVTPVTLGKGVKSTCASTGV